MKYSGIGGQAVIEGIMMKNGEKYAVAVRDEKGGIVVSEDVYTGLVKQKWVKWPFVRGVFSFIDSLVLGIKTLMFSASVESGEDETLTKGEMTWTVILAVLIAVGVFMVLPTVLINFLGKVIASEALLAFLEGILRLLFFITYIVAISQMKEIKRTFMYHGSEHKCINCVEHGLPLTVDNVMSSSKEHRRCGTSFLFLVMAVAILLFMVVRFDNLLLKVLSRIVLIPVIAGISYEILRVTGRYDNILTRIISKPGMWLQALTTKEPTPDMCEVAIEAVERVFDWQAFLKDNFEA